MRIGKMAFCLGILVLFQPGQSSAQSSGGSRNHVPRFTNGAALPKVLSIERKGELSPAAQKAVAEAAADAEALPDTSPAITKAEEEYDLARIEYQKWTLTDLRRTYHWQNVASVIIFVVVIALVLAGVFFSWVQFRAAGFKSDPASFDGSLQGIKLTTSALGLLILAISMGFFYLYLVYVYPINIHNAGQAVSDANKVSPP